MERLLLVHGSVVGGRSTWAAQRDLAGRWELDVLERPGFWPGPPVERVNFEPDAQLVADRLGSGAHLVGHSYGGVICLLAAARRPEGIRSLTVIEPPAFDVARGDPAVDAFGAGGERWWREGPTGDPEAFLRGFLGFVGSSSAVPSSRCRRSSSRARAR